MVCALCKATLEASTPLFPVPDFSSSLYLYHSCRTCCGIYISPTVAFFSALCFVHLPSAAPPPSSHIVSLVFYRSGCFTFFATGSTMNPHHIILSPFLRNTSFIIIPRHRFCFLLPPLPPPLTIRKHNRNQQRTDYTLTPACTIRLLHHCCPSLCLSSAPARPRVRLVAIPFVVCISRPRLPGHVFNGPFCLCSLCISRFGSRIPLQSYRYTLLKFRFLSLPSCVLSCVYPRPQYPLIVVSRA